MTRPGVLGVWVLALALLAGCGASTPARRAAPRESPPPPLPALIELMPAGASLVLVARPAELWRSEAVHTVVHAVAPPELLDAFARRTGVDPTEVEEIVVGEFEDGFVLFARGPWRAADIVRAGSLRMAQLDASEDAPLVRRRGYIGTDYRDFVALDEHVLAVSSAPLHVLAPVVSRVRTGRWPTDRGPAMTPAIRALAATYGGGPAVVYAPGPLALPPGLAVSTLLDGVDALAATLHTDGEPGTFRVEVAFWGAMPDGASGNLTALVRSVGESDLGRALGIEEGLPTLRAEADGRSARLSITLRAASVATGLRILFLGEIRELVGT